MDSLQITLDLIESSLNTFNYEEISKEYEDINYKYHYLLDNYPNKNNPEFWINHMNYMHRVKKAFGRYVKSYPKIKEQLSYGRNQLQTLKNSIIDKKLTDEEVEKYLNDEKTAVNDLSMKVSRFKPEIENSNIIWDSISDDINAIFQSLDPVSQH